MNIPNPPAGWWEKVPAIKELVALMNYPSTVNWDLARQVASALATDDEPEDDASVKSAIDGVWHLAESTAAEYTSLVAHSVTEPRYVDRSGWIHDAVKPFSPVFESLANKMSPADLPPEAAGVIGRVASVFCGFEAGCVMGYMSKNIWSDADIAIPTSTQRHIDFVTTNLSSASREWSVDTRDLMLWLSLHNALRNLVVSKDWIGDYATRQVHEIIQSLDFDPSHLELTLGGFDPSDPTRLQGILDRPDQLIRAAKTSEGLEPAARLETLVNLLDAYITYSARGCGVKLLGESVKRLEEITSRRKAAAGDSLLDRMLGVELSRKNTQQALLFCENVVDVKGPEALNLIWTNPDLLPTKSELSDPVVWLART